VGSTHQNEEELLIDTYMSLKKEFSDLSMVLAPRHPERAGEVEELLNRKHLAYQRRSSPEPDKPVLLLDTVGELSRLYGIGSLSFVGGSLVPTGGHNILEPAIYGVPVVFGPHMENFPEISVVVKERDGGVQVKDSEELVQVMGDLLRDPEKSHRMGKAGMQIIQENQGALKRTLELIDTIFPGE
jgi:3-deoxy-D-manno-octulosonic-acid transferase